MQPFFAPVFLRGAAAPEVLRGAAFFAPEAFAAVFFAEDFRAALFFAADFLRGELFFSAVFGRAVDVLREPARAAIASSFRGGAVVVHSGTRRRGGSRTQATILRCSRPSLVAARSSIARKAASDQPTASGPTRVSA